MVAKDNVGTKSVTTWHMEMEGTIIFSHAGCETGEQAVLRVKQVQNSRFLSLHTYTYSRFLLSLQPAMQLAMRLRSQNIRKKLITGARPQRGSVATVDSAADTAVHSSSSVSEKLKSTTA